MATPISPSLPVLRAALLGVVAMLGLAASPSAAAAQQPPPAVPDSARDPRLDLMRGIALRPDQRARVDSIEAEFASAARQVDSRSTSAGETVVRLQTRAAERQRALRAVLTVDQQVIFDRNLAELRAWMLRERHP